MQSKIEIKKEHLIFCFDSLEAYFKKMELPEYPKYLDNQICPLFVTWLKMDKTTEKKILRGCIGTFYPDSLSENLQKFTFISALEDDRFGEIKIEEMRDISLSLSFLYDFEIIQNFDNWEIGIHGVFIQYYDEIDNDFKSATYLPEVMVINNWDKKETFRRCMKKSGYKGDYDNYLKIDMKITIYKSTKGSMSYEEYENLKSN